MATVEDSTGVVVGVDAAPVTDPTTVTFAVPFRVSSIDLAATYRASGTVIDSGRQWSAEEGVPVITDGAPFAGVDVPVLPQTGTPPCVDLAPSASPLPTEAPGASASTTP